LSSSFSKWRTVCWKSVSMFGSFKNWFSRSRLGLPPSHVYWASPADRTTIDKCMYIYLFIAKSNWYLRTQNVYLNFPLHVSSDFQIPSGVNLRYSHRDICRQSLMPMVYIYCKSKWRYILQIHKSSRASSFIKYFSPEDGCI
jgi:hypothetical protein